MVRRKQWAGGLLALLTGVLALGLWWASTRQAPPDPEGAPPAPGAASSMDAGTLDPARQEADAFAQKALETLRAAGFKGELRYDPERFLIQVPDAEGQKAQTIFLTNIYGEYLGAPPEERDEVLRRVTAVGRAPETPTSYAAARSALLPVVRPRASFEVLEILDPSDPMTGLRIAEWRPLGEVLAVALVHDTPDAMKYLGPKELKQWGITFEEAAAAAVENLRRQSQDALIPLSPGTCLAPWRDSYASSRLLLDEVLRRCPVRGEPVVFTPNRDVLLITGSQDDDGLLRAAELAWAAFQTPRPVDGRALRRTAGGWQPFLPARTSKAWQPMRKLMVYSQARDYTEQRERLASHHEQFGVDLFVADFVPYEDEQGRVFSQAVWVQGIDTLLPRTDMIWLMDSALGPEAPPLAVVRWEIVMRDVGNLLPPVEGYYPARHRPQGFPSPEQIARWKKDPRVMDVP
jgi:uncharacterized protein YtpQ (UPF0354 family)